MFLNNKTALLVACEKEYVDIVKLLLEREDILIEYCVKLMLLMYFYLWCFTALLPSPLDIAYDLENDEIIDLLLQKEQDIEYDE